MKENKLIIENTSSSDISKIEVGYDKILYRIYTQSLASSVCSKIKVKSTVGKIFAFGSFYDKNYEGSDKSSLPFGTVESNYSGDKEHSQEGDVKAIIKNKLISRDFECLSKNLKSVWTIEALQDFASLLNNEDAEKILEQELSTEIIQEMDKSLIEFCLKEGKKQTITLDNEPTYTKIVSEIQKYGIQMATNMKRVPYLKVIASSYICGLLSAHPNFDSSKVDFSKNTYYFGKINNIDIYCDALNVASDIGEDFAIILYNSETDRPSSSLTYVQYEYGYTFYKTINSKDNSYSYFHGNRYDIIKHPLDDGTTGNSKFITYLSFPNRVFP